MSEFANEEKEKFKMLVNDNKGKPFSTNGICTLKKYWQKTLGIIFLNMIILIPSFYFLFYVDWGKDIVQFHLHPIFYRFLDQQLTALKTEKFILIAIVFWFSIFELMMVLYIVFLKIKRFRSVDINPWLSLIPVYSSIIAYFLPCKRDFTENKFFNKELKPKWLFVLILAIFSLLFLIECFYDIYMIFV